MEGYYLYLPAMFINDGFKDLKCFSGCTVPNKELGWVHSKYTYGVALKCHSSLQAMRQPSCSTMNPMDTQNPTHMQLLVSGLFYFLVGLLLLGKFLTTRFSTWVVNLVLLSIGLGTNAYYYATVGAGMSHIYSFFLFVLVLIYTARWKEKGGLLNTIVLALVSALIILIRPTGLIMLLWIPLSGISDLESFLNRLKLIFSSGLAIVAPLLLECSSCLNSIIGSSFLEAGSPGPTETKDLPIGTIQRSLRCCSATEWSIHVQSCSGPLTYRFALHVETRASEYDCHYDNFHSGHLCLCKLVGLVVWRSIRTSGLRGILRAAGNSNGLFLPMDQNQSGCR